MRRHTRAKYDRHCLKIFIFLHHFTCFDYVNRSLIECDMKSYCWCCCCCFVSMPENLYSCLHIMTWIPCDLVIWPDVWNRLWTLACIACYGFIKRIFKSAEYIYTHPCFMPSWITRKSITRYKFESDHCQPRSIIIVSITLPRSPSSNFAFMQSYLSTTYSQKYK